MWLWLTSRELRIIPTPGHTPGSVAIVYADKFVFTGDSLFFSRAEVGRGQQPTNHHSWRGGWAWMIMPWQADLTSPYVRVRPQQTDRA